MNKRARFLMSLGLELIVHPSVYKIMPDENRENAYFVATY